MYRKKALKKAENMHSIRKKIGPEGHFSALYVIIKVPPPHLLACTIHPIPPNLRPLTPTSYAQSSLPTSLLLVS